MEPIKTFRSKNELVYEMMRNAILQGDMTPGTRIKIDEVADALHVSQIPVREALRQLEADGFVTNKPYTGATVTDVDADQVVEIFGLLEAMELLSGREACRIAGETEITALEQLLSEMDGLLDNPHQWSEENVRFHHLICYMAQMPLVRMMMQKVSDHWYRLRSLYFKDVFVPRMAQAQADHRAMVEAIRTGDAEAVERIIRAHNRMALEAYMQFLERRRE